MTRHIPDPRGVLFVPGSRPERFGKALASGAGLVIVDFEDAVEEALKGEARDRLGAFLHGNPQARLAVRINAPRHAQHLADIAFCARHPGITAIVLPKAECAAQIDLVASSGKPIWPLVESARGLLALGEVARAPGVERLTFGALDLALDLGLAGIGGHCATVLDQARYVLLLHSTDAGLARPIDTVFPDIADLSGLAEAAGKARALGFAGMLCIHPSQVMVVDRAFAPSAEERAWARRVLERAVEESGAFKLNGEMVDAPVIARARQLLETPDDA